MAAPTLLVGLGGTGSKIISEVSDLATEEQRKHIAFAVFDTDINELEEIQKKKPFIKTIQTSTKLCVGEYLNEDQHARDAWFPVNAILNSKPLTEGAGQVRSISRLAFDTALRAGHIEPLHEAIQELYKLEDGKADQALRVIIVSSLAGGTGSGLILPVGLYIKNYLRTHFRQSANITRGFFILPEVFDEVIHGQNERNSLRSNAYATLRELDAFLMKGDATLPERFKKSVRLEFPRVGSSGYEEYNIRPYDFCFLFDAQNSEGSKLNSFRQYLSHAANCIYAQSIGPMNKRSNSSEDNTIRSLCAERGRNRYAGAGSSMLIYPFEDIKRYIALNWAKKSISDQWLVFDLMTKLQEKENDEKRRKGVHIAKTNTLDSYVTNIEQMSKNKDEFASAIIDACSYFDENGFRTNEGKWLVYINELIRKIEADASSGQELFDAQEAKATASLASLDKNEIDWSNYEKTFYDLDDCRRLVEKHGENSAMIIAYTVFNSSKNSFVKDDQPYQLETYLRDVNKKFIHPNAMRYFLIRSYKQMLVAKDNTDRALKKLKDYFNDFDRNVFDDPETENIIENAGSLADKKSSISNKVFKVRSGEQSELKENYDVFLSNVKDYRKKYQLALVLNEGINHLLSLCSSFQKFYESFETKVGLIASEIDRLEKKYDNIKGTTARYVCASSTCMDKMFEEMSYTGTATDVDGELSGNILASVKKFSQLTNKPNSNAYFSNVFEKEILEYFEKTLIDSFKEQIDVDVITALENEIKYEKEISDNSIVLDEVKKIICNTRALSNPFIERPLGEQKDPINACAFNAKLRQGSNEDSERNLLVNKYFSNLGGVEDSDIPKNMVLFYQSFYGLRANDLSKFAPPEKSKTYNRTGGEYFKAYYDLVDMIHPEPHLSKEITPHIDRWWHIITKMPDLDEENQKRQEQRIYAAFFWAILGRYIDLYPDGAEKMTYMLKVDDLGIDFQDMNEVGSGLIVSNGSVCDRLYEVLDAIAIYPDLVNKIMDKVEQFSNEDSDNSCTGEAENGMLYEYLDTFTVSEYMLNGNAVRSIFDIPFLMKKSINADLYYQEDVLNILKAEIYEIKRYLLRICTEKELPKVMSKVLRTQFEKYLADVEMEKAEWPGIYKDQLFDRTCSIIINGFDELGLKTEARALKKRVEEIRNQQS